MLRSEGHTKNCAFLAALQSIPFYPIINTCCSDNCISDGLKHHAISLKLDPELALGKITLPDFVSYGN